MNARTATIIGSVVLHGALALAAVLYDSGQKRHHATSVMVVGEEKKKEPQKKTEPPKPPPPKRVAMRSRETIPAPRLTPVPVKTEPTHQVKSTAPPQATGDYSNTSSEPGNSTGGGGGQGGGEPSRVPVNPVKVATPKRTTEEDPCRETPTKPQPVSRPTEIEYTQQARADGVEGRLVLKIVVGDDGAVSDVVVVSGVDPSLDAAAIAAVKSWVFKPALRCGKQMSGGVFMYAHRFELGD